MRTFLAIDIPEDITKELEGAITQLQDLVAKDEVRWVRPQSVHLTLKFFGEIKPDFIKHIETVLDPIAARTEAMSLTVAGFGMFPNPRNPRVLWAGIHEDNGTLIDLRDEIERSFEKFGFKPDRRAFHPHLTLGRVKRNAGKKSRERLSARLKGFNLDRLGEIKAKELILFESELNPTGAIYRILRKFQLSE